MDQNMKINQCRYIYSRWCNGTVVLTMLYDFKVVGSNQVAHQRNFLFETKTS